MKKLAIPLFCLIAVTITILGKVHYDQKLSTIGKTAKEQQLLDSNISSAFVTEDIIGYTANMDDVLREKLFRKFEANESITLLAIGSEASFGSQPENPSWPFRLESALTEYYNGANFNLETMNFEDMSTHHLIEINAHSHAASIQPDVLIFEPLLLNDNGIVKVEDSIKNIEILIDAVIEESPEVFVIIQPPNPIFRPTIYLEHVEALKEFAQNNNFTYLDHWQAWPDLEEDELKDLLTGVYPNARGQEIWAEYLMNYFVAK